MLLHPFLSSSLPYFFPSFLHSLRPSFLTSLLPSFLPSFMATACTFRAKKSYIPARRHVAGRNPFTKGLSIGGKAAKKPTVRAEAKSQQKPKSQHNQKLPKKAKITKKKTNKFKKNKIPPPLNNPLELGMWDSNKINSSVYTLGCYRTARLAESHIHCVIKVSECWIFNGEFRSVTTQKKSKSSHYSIRSVDRKLWSQYSCGIGKPSSFIFDMFCLPTSDLARAGIQFHDVLCISHALTVSHVAWHESASVCTWLAWLCVPLHFLRTTLRWFTNKSRAWAFL